MRTLPLFCTFALLAAGCSPREADVRGTLAEGWPNEPLFVWVEGQPARVEVLNDTFALPGLRAGPVRLTIASEEDELAQVNIHDIAAGASLSLERIRLEKDRDLAFPSAVQVEGADVVTINGIRMAGPDALPRRLDAEGVVLALGRGADAMIVRPGSADLPDLPVVVTPATHITAPGDEDASLEEMSAGDVIRVGGQTASGYLIAERIHLVGTSVEIGTATGTSSDRAPDKAARRTDRATEDRRAKTDRARAEGRAETDQGTPQRGRFEIPEGHRPPPGECRDWNPNLPPGQQPPPRKC